MKILLLLIAINCFSFENSLRKEILEAESKRVEWENRVNKLKKEFNYYANKYNIKVNLDGYEFKMIKIKGIPSRQDFFNSNIIYLPIDFNEYDFYHELGHSVMNYSHVYFDDKDNSDFIMSYFFNKKLWNKNKDKYIKLFLKKSLHHDIDSVQGLISHKRMILLKYYKISTLGWPDTEINDEYNKQTQIK